MVAILGVGCASSDPAERPSATRAGTFELLTYNVAGLPAGLSRSRPARNHALISPLLASYDLVLLQEDFGYWHDDLVADAGLPFVSEPKRPTRAPVGDGLTRLSRFPWRDHERVMWPVLHGVRGHGSDALSEKGFDVARVTLAPGVDVDVYGLHADAGGSDEDHDSRARGFAALADHLAGVSAGRAVIVAGDFNAWPDSARDGPVLDGLCRGAALRDAGRELADDRSHIDRVLYRSGGGVELTATSWQVAGEFVDGTGEPLSDHPAIHVGFAWQADR
ncbi:MAG: endonuclease/exonuclease/phosphatase family protein [Planctomycetes bacterium]|nr:endonuclease/exonuclease/phosphatase family protein [Planctomycetota bacterium]